jgi:hypothetical protein
VLGGDDALAVDLEAGQRREYEPEASTTCGRCTRRAVDLDLARPGEPAGALDDGDAAALDQALRPLKSRATTPSL